MADGAGTGLSSTRTISSSFKPARAARESVRPVCVLPVSWRFFFCLKNLRLLHGYFCRATQESWPRFQDLELLWRRGRGQRQKPWPAACPRRRVCLDVSGMITFLFVFQCFLVVFLVHVLGSRSLANEEGQQPWFWCRGEGQPRFWCRGEGQPRFWCRAEGQRPVEAARHKNDLCAAVLHGHCLVSVFPRESGA